MYCPVCGSQATQGLNFCKRCGTNLTAPTGGSENYNRPPTFAYFMAGAVSLAGIIALFATITTLSQNENLHPGLFFGLIAIGGITVLGIIAIFAWLLLRLTGIPTSSSKPEIRTSEYAQLQPPQSIPSVTENTTRNFVYRGESERETPQ
ncbi:MAG: hypothetical protein AB1631_22790 [Acidobacteriota bacterium]